MADETRLQRLTTQIEWRWTLAQTLWGIPAALAGFALPAWAVRGTAMFEQYAPASWVAAGFAGAVISTLLFMGVAWGRSKLIRSKYDAKMLAQGGTVDALEKTFERKRIYLNEFCLPSHPLIENKSFIDCEIIGPANVLFELGNNISEGKYPVCDAVYMKDEAAPLGNCYLIRGCIFRGCSFQRVTFFVPFQETNMFRGFNLVRWLTTSPYDLVSQEIKSETHGTQLLPSTEP